MRKTISALLFYTFIAGVANGQGLRFGLTGGVHTGLLLGIDDTRAPGHGFSSEPYRQQPRLQGSFGLRVQQPLGLGWEVEGGLQYATHGYDVRFDVSEFGTGEQTGTTLQIRLAYLEMPVQLNKAFRNFSKNGQMVAGIGLKPALVLRRADNYNDIIYEQIYLLTDKWYRPFNVFAHGSFGLRQQLAMPGHLEIALIATVGLLPMVGEEDGWGFYENLYRARQVELGVSGAYFFGR